MYSNLTIPVAVVLCLLSLFGQAFAAPGDLDASFGVGGRALASIGQISQDSGFASAVQPDGKIVVAGDSLDDSEFAINPLSLFITRFNPDGSLDTSFGQQGRTVFRMKTGPRATSVVVLSDGKILIGGHVFVYQGNEYPPSSIQKAFLFVRLMPDGTPDNSFGSGGVLKQFPDATAHNQMGAMTVQPDGKIVATGFTSVPPSQSTPHALLITRYNSDGSPDNSFDGDGKVVLNINATGNRGNAIAIQSDGKIVVGGSLKETSSSVTDFLIVRVNSDGSPDTSFDGDGRLTTKFGSTTSSIVGIAIQGDGRIVAAGSSNSGTLRNIAVARYTSSGAPDPTFDLDGNLITDIGDDAPTGLAIQADGKIVVGGQTALTGGGFDFLAIRYNTDGSFDNSFDGDGKAITAVTTVFDRANSMFIEPDGQIVLAGFSRDIPDTDLSLVRHNVDGSLDTTFDGDGKLIAELGNAGDAIYDTAIQTDGKIVAAGYAFGGQYVQPAVARFNADGTLDTTFASNGKLILPASDRHEYAAYIAVQSDGKIAFSIHTYQGGPYKAVRLNSNGTLDDSFGGSGIVTVPVGTVYDEPYGLVLESDGKVVLGGTSNSNGIHGPSMVRLNTDGSLDPSFGTGGKVFETNASVGIYTLALQADGKIVLAGSTATPTPGQSAIYVARYNSNGSPDTAFGGGTGSTSTLVGTFNSASSSAIQSDGKIVISAYTDQNASIVRYNSDGTLDTTFSQDGKVYIPNEGNMYFHFNELAIDAAGKLVLVGRTVEPIYVYKALVYRFLADGSVDTTFGSSGRVITSLGNYDAVLNSVEILANGKILAGGLSSNGMNDDFTLVRFLGDSIAGGAAPFDFDGDGRTDVGIFRPSVAEWWINRSSNGLTFATQFGATTDAIVPADYTGDGKADVAFWRPSTGEWYVLRSEDFSFFAFPFGANGDTPASADYDGDGKVDHAVFRSSKATWYIRRSSDGGTTIQSFGANGDVPVPADYDGDHKADIAIYRPSLGQWWLNRSTAGVIATTFGDANTKPVQGDFTGDSKADVAFFRPSTGEWFVLRSEDFSYYSFPFGAVGDTPAPGDYDGDGKFDATVFRSSNATWYSFRGSGTVIQQFGQSGDRAIPNAFVP